MLVLAIILSSVTGFAVMLQLAGAGRYVYWFKHYTSPEVDDGLLPPAAIILCLRGSDPFLVDCLDRLTSQDYPQFCVHVVLDHPTDPARELVEEWIEAHPDREITIDFLEEWSNESYLKTSAVRQSIKALDDSVGAAVLADADTLVYRGWLRDLVSPMIDSDVGVVTGNRWYDPTRRSWGSSVRYVYNALCVVPMFFMRATWGGSLAIRRDVFNQPYFFDRMRKTSCEDHAIQDAARNQDLRLEVHPDVMMLNREECTLKSCFGFVRRQLIWTRLYHPNWNQIVFGVIAAHLILIEGTVVAIAAALTAHEVAAALIFGAVLVQWVTALIILEWLHATIAHRASASREEPFPRITWSVRLRLLIALPIALWLLTIAVISATLSRRVEWRGITYRIIPPNGIRMVEYRPYAETAGSAAEGASPT